MKKTLLSTVIITALIFSVVSCKNKAEEANTSEAEPAAVEEVASAKYVVDVKKSNLDWKGFKPTGTHNGTVNIETGIINTVDGKIQSGSFIIDMKSIKILDLEGDMKANLESHLKGTVEGKEDHFFDVSKFPSAAFEITNAESNADGSTKLSGNLTIKGQKHNVSFPVWVKTNGDELSITSEAFTIDRTKWGVNYGSKSIFDNLGDKFINDEIELKVNIKAYN